MADEQATTSRGASTTGGVIPAAQPAAVKPDTTGFAPIKASDDDKNPVKVELPKTPEAIAKEGTALSAAGSDDAGGNVPVVTDSGQPGTAKRLWTLDSDQNVSLRHVPVAATPDLVEFGA